MRDSILSRNIRQLLWLTRGVIKALDRAAVAMADVICNQDLDYIFTCDMIHDFQNNLHP